jgi:hypothetical protein
MQLSHARSRSINRNRNRDYLKNRNRHDYAKNLKADNRLKIIETRLFLRLFLAFQKFKV